MKLRYVLLFLASMPLIVKGLDIVLTRHAQASVVRSMGPRVKAYYGRSCEVRAVWVERRAG